MHFFPVPRVFYRPFFYTSIQHGCKYFDSCVICAVSLHLMPPRDLVIPPRDLAVRRKSRAEKDMSWAPVYAFVKRIPRGRVITYGGLAKALRLRGGARSAGRAMAASPSGKGVPWHRVIGERGKILIREPYASLQRKLLESEGVTILESRVDLKRHLWKPQRKSAPKFRAPKKRIHK